MRRWLALIGLTLVLILFTLVVSTPAMLSTTWGQQRLLTVINERIPGRVEAGNLSLSWFGPQKIDSFKLRDIDGKLVAKFETLSIQTSLFGLLATELSDVSIHQLFAEIRQKESGTNLSSSLGIPIPLELPAGQEITLSNVNASVKGLSETGFSVIASGDTTHGKVTGSFNIDSELSISNNRLKADIKHFPVGLIEAITALVKPEALGVSSALLGETFDLQLDTLYDGNQAVCNAMIHSPRTQVELSCAIAGNEFKLQKPFKTTIALPPNVFQTFYPALKPAAPLSLEIQLKDLNVPLEFFTSGLSKNLLRTLALNGSLSLPKAQFTNAQGELVGVNGFLLKIDSHGEAIKIDAEGTYALNNHPIPFLLATLVNKPYHSDNIISTFTQPLNIRLTLPKVATSSLNLYTGNQPLDKVFGKELTLSIASSSEDPQALTMQVSSSLLDIPFLKVTIDQPLRLAGDLLANPYSGELIADAIVMKQHGSSAIRSLRASWKAENNLSHLSASFNGATESASENRSGSFEGFFDLNGPENIKINISGKEIPARFLALLSGRQEWDPIFGPSLSMNISAQMRSFDGPFKADISGSQGSLNVQGRLNHGILTLDQTATFTTTPTEKLGKDVLSQFAPVFGDLISGEDKISITIDKEGFSIPVIPLLPEKANIGSAMVQLGKLHFHNNGDIKRLLSLLKADKVKEAVIWTTPLYLKMENGFLIVYRMDLLLLDRYPLATWGTVDFAKDKVNMVLGLTGQAIASAFGAQGISKSTMMQIPITGKTSKIKIDSTKAMTKIGAILAKQEGSPEGIVIGTVLDLANGKEGKVPAPTTDPLPWQDLIGSNEKSTIPVKDIKRGASKLLKELFQ